MANKTVQDWMVATSTEGQAHAKQEITRDMAGSKTDDEILESLLITTGIDLGILTIPKVMSDMGPFLGPEEDLTIVARGKRLLDRCFSSD